MFQILCEQLGNRFELWIQRNYSNIYKISILYFLCSLYRWGGQYLDLDTVMIKNISKLGVNFAGAEDGYYVNNAVVNIDIKTDIGKKVSEQWLT